MKTYASARYKGAHKPFTLNHMYDIEIRYYYLGIKIHVQACRIHNTVKPIKGYERTYNNLTDFAMDWDVKAMWESRQQAPKVLRDDE